MTQDEIKKALEICNDIYAPCNGCPYDINSTLHTDALKLINEQEKEIERLRTTLGQCNTELNSALESLKSQCREIGALKAEVKQAQIDVLCKSKQRSWCDNFFADGKWHRYVFVDDIDELIEEVENDKCNC